MGESDREGMGSGSEAPDEVRAMLEEAGGPVDDALAVGRALRAPGASGRLVGGGIGFLRVRQRLSPLFTIPASLAPFAIGFVLWIWATTGEPEARHISPVTLPSPAEVVAGAPALWYDSALMRNVVLSLVRVLGGFTVAAVIALPLGIAMGSFSRIAAVFALFTTVISYLPIAAIVPLTIAWWKTGEQQKIGFLAIGTFAYLLPLVVRRINAVDHNYILSAESQGATQWQIVRRVLVPIALPGIFDALRLCLGIGWTYIVLAEVVKGGEGVGGVGNLIIVFQRRGLMDQIYLTLAAIMLVGAVLDRACGVLGRLLFPYRSASE